MEYAYAFLALLALALAASVAIYFYIAHKEEKPAVKKTAQPVMKVETPPQPRKEPPYPLPPGLPRTIETIKQLAQMDPEIVANICKRWLRK